MSHRLHGRPTPSRGARGEQRKAERPAKKPMVVPDHIRALTDKPKEDERRG